MTRRCLIVVISLRYFGLYSTHLRAKLSDVLGRVVAALIVAFCAVGALFYLVPTLRLWRGVDTLAVAPTFCGVVLLRMVFALNKQKPRPWAPRG